MVNDRLSTAAAQVPDRAGAGAWAAVKALARRGDKERAAARASSGSGTPGRTGATRQ